MGSIVALRGGDITHYRRVDFRPEKDRNRVVVRRWDVCRAAPGIPDAPGFRAGVVLRVATINRASFRVLVRSLRALSRARVRCTAKDGKDTVFAVTGDGPRQHPYGRIRISAGKAGVTELPLVLTSFGRLLVADTSNRAAFGGLLYEYADTTQAKWDWREGSAAERQGASAALMAWLKSEPRGFGWRYGVMALGVVGPPGCEEGLSGLVPATVETREAIRIITVRRQSDAKRPAPDDLVTAFMSTDPWINNWADTFAKKTFGAKGYDKILRAAFARATPAQKEHQLQYLVEVPLLRELARDAIDDEDAGVRVEAALILDERAVLRSIAADRSLLKTRDFDARLDAIWSLGHIVEDRPDDAASDQAVRAQLLAQLLDRGEDSRIRNAIARMMGNRQYAPAIPGLIAILEGKPKPVYLGEPRQSLMFAAFEDPRLGAVYALGVLRARKAIPGMVKLLKGKRVEELGLRKHVGLALAQIGGEGVRPALERGRAGALGPGEQQWWDLCLALYDAIANRDIRATLKYSQGSTRAVARLLTDLFDAASIDRAFKEQPGPRYSRALEEARRRAR